MAQQRLTQDELLKFDALGNVTLLHVADIHGQLMPVYFREPSINLGVGEARGQPPHLTGADFLKRFGIPAEVGRGLCADARRISRALAQSYGRIGGLDRLATVVKAVRAERGDKVLLLDGGDTWQGSLGANAQPRPGHGRLHGAAQARRHDRPLGIHLWRGARQGADRRRSASRSWRSTCATPNGTSRCSTPMKMFERGGVKIAVLGQAFPYTPVANPRWMMPKWSFGIREEDVRANVEKARKSGAQLVVLLSHNGFDVDRKLAARVAGHRRDPDRRTPTTRCPRRSRSATRC